MTDREILSNAIDKAIANGWILEHPVHTNTSISDFIIQMFDSIDEYPYMQFEHMAGIIFSHSFAKTFFGEEYIPCPIYDNDNQIVNDIGDVAWAYHLQTMVLEENPIQYLEKFL